MKRVNYKVETASGDTILVLVNGPEIETPISLLMKYTIDPLSWDFHHMYPCIFGLIIIAYILFLWSNILLNHLFWVIVGLYFLLLSYSTYDLGLISCVWIGAVSKSKV